MAKKAQTKKAPNKSTPKQAVGGWNIYKNKNNQTVMYDLVSKNGYVILPDDVSNFNLYHNRYALSIALGMILVSFMNDWVLPLIACLALAAVLEFRYRKVWLPTLVCIPKFKPENKIGFIDSLVEANNPTRYIMLVAAYAAFGILLVVNGYQMNASIVVIVVNYLVCAACLYLAACYLTAFIRIKK